jgi:hypothetical protein
MISWLRKLFRKEPKDYLGGLQELAIKRSMEIWPCCGGMQRAHVQYRSGKYKCPQTGWGPIDKAVKKAKLARMLKYNPLAVDEEWYPHWMEPHATCSHCGCKRGLHEYSEETGRRGSCEDPDCPKKCQECVF